MCGFAVDIQRYGPVAHGRLSAALASMQHRGPDASGIAIVQPGDDGPSVGLAHARLSIIDLDVRSNQPFRRGQHHIVYNGEIYNYRDLAGDMALTTSGDTEVLLNLLAGKGVEAVAACNGMWAFAWLDEAARRLTAARDAYGKKPLFYIISETRICLASTLAALMAMTGAPPRAEAAELAGFVASGWSFPDAAAGRTHLAGVRELRPGHALEIDLAAWRINERRVLEVDAGDVRHPPDDDQLPALLADAVRSRLIGERSLGLMLSGGIDSTLILSVLAAEGCLDQVICITGEAGKSEDGRYARACVEAVGARAIELQMDYGEASLDHFLDVCAHQEKPFPLIGNVLGLHALYDAMQREGITVALDGAGADEIFGGYWYRQAGFAIRDAALAGDKAWISHVENGGMVPSRFIGTERRIAPSFEALTAHDLAIISPDGHAILGAALPSDRLTRFDGSLHEALRLDATTGRMQEWLWQNDRSAMAASIENRSPFLDERLAPWMAQGYRAKFDGQFNKPVLRRLFEAFQQLPSSARIDKQGFRWVYGRFARHNRAALLELVAGSAVAGLFIDRSRYLDALRRQPDMLESPLTQRLIVLAGLEAVGKLSAPT
jgi:asparagine synthase (glutamine-hydrolysing)